MVDYERVPAVALDAGSLGLANVALEEVGHVHNRYGQSPIERLTGSVHVPVHQQQ